MNKNIKILSGLFVVFGMLIGLVGCGGSGDNDASSTSSATRTTSSPYLRKIGDNGAVLKADATNWKMVEIVDEGLLVENPSYSESLKLPSFRVRLTLSINGI